ncbi:MAG: aminotransferase DegT [Flavobacteriales bacterium]|nr:aminotransferase DegT [Flavobacteriales bacterium]
MPVNQPIIDPADIRAVTKSLKSGWISSEGPNVKKFEEKFSKFIGHKFGVAVSNGTAALEIAVKSLNLKKNDEIIIPNFTIISNALPALKLGIKMKFVDCNIDDWNFDLNKLKKEITSKTKAIIATHIYNYPIRMDILKRLCSKRKIIIIEDAAEVFGQKLFKRKCGSFGDISTFSFYANKNITTGEGGMIVTNNKSLRDRCRSLRNLCFQDKKRFLHSELGWNYRLTNIQAAIGLAQLERIELIVEKKKKIGALYNDLLKNLKGISLPMSNTDYANNIYWIYGILINKKNLNADELINILKSKGIGARPFFYPLHLQPVLNEYKKYNASKFPISEKISKQGLYLPSGLGISYAQIKKVANVLGDIFG